MREIKFRGKRVDNNQWVYGYYFTTPLTIENFGAGHLGDGIKRHCISTDMGVVYAVIPETVGQFTGLLDKNGKEVYEGDIVRIHQFLFDGTEYENMLIGKIIYQKETISYCLTNLNNEQIQEYMGYKDDYTSFQKECVPFDCFYGLHEESFEIIGNIHDNKDLLK